MQTPYDRWWKRLNAGELPPTPETILPEGTPRLADITRHVGCHPSEPDLNVILNHAYQKLGRAAIAYNTIRESSQYHDCNHLLAMHIEEIALLKAEIAHIQRIQNERVPLFE